MNKIKDISRPLILIGLTILFSILLNFIPKSAKVFNYKIEHVDMLMDVKPDSVLDLEYNVPLELELK